MRAEKRVEMNVGYDETLFCTGLLRHSLPIAIKRQGKSEKANGNCDKSVTKIFHKNDRVRL